jgi:hypothetical protein
MIKKYLSDPSADLLLTGLAALATAMRVREESLLFGEESEGESLLQVVASGLNANRTLGHSAAICGFLDLRDSSEEFLTIPDTKGLTIAHAAASSGTLPASLQTERILSLLEGVGRGKSVAHYAARTMTLRRDVSEDILRGTDFLGETVYHVLAASGADVSVPEDALVLADKSGRTVAHELARRSALPEEFMTFEILSLADDHGRTVAHELARAGGMSMPDTKSFEQLLSLKDKNGISVAHELALSETLPRQFAVLPHILSIEDAWGTTVKDVLKLRTFRR